MSPEQISALTAISAIVANVGTWPIGSVIFAVALGPWVMVYFFTRSMAKQLAAAIRMYENSNKLVERYDKISVEHVDTIRLSTSATVELITYLKTRVPCFERIADKTRRLPAG